MSIDFQATSVRFTESLLNGAACARRLGVSRSTFNQVLSGKYPNMNGRRARIVLNFLRERNILVEIENNNKAV